MLKGESLIRSLSAGVAELFSVLIECHAPLLAPKRSVSQLFTWVSSAAKICGVNVSVIVPFAKPDEVMSSCWSTLFWATVAPRMNRSLEPRVQSPEAPTCQLLSELSFVVPVESLVERSNEDHLKAGITMMFGCHRQKARAAR